MNYGVFFFFLSGKLQNILSPFSAWGTLEFVRGGHLRLWPWFTVTDKWGASFSYSANSLCYLAIFWAESASDGYRSGATVEIFEFTSQTENIGHIMKIGKVLKLDKGRRSDWIFASVALDFRPFLIFYDFTLHNAFSVWSHSTGNHSENLISPFGHFWNGSKVHLGQSKPKIKSKVWSAPLPRSGVNNRH